jgi:four helix bundle protein
MNPELCIPYGPFSIGVWIGRTGRGNKFKMKKNALLDKTYALSLEAISTYKQLVKSKEYILSKQFLRCSTAPGAMAAEAQSAHSRKDFIAKLEIGLKELRESKYWLALLCDSSFLKHEEQLELKQLQNECEALLTSIIVSSKRKL